MEAVSAFLEPVLALRLGDQVYTRPIEAIATNRLPEGSKIQEDELVTQLGVSKTPIREAYKDLTRKSAKVRLASLAVALAGQRRSLFQGHGPALGPGRRERRVIQLSASSREPVVEFGLVPGKHAEARGFGQFISRREEHDPAASILCAKVIRRRGRRCLARRER